jgi:ribokinase
VAPLPGVTVVGSANLDLVASVERCPLPGETLLAHGYVEHPGGKGLNQAVAAARSGAPTRFVAALGDDDAGRRLLDVMRAEGIDADHVTVVAGPTGRALIAVGADGENSIVVVPGANARATWSVAPVSAVVLAQLEIPSEVVIDAFAAARQAGALTVLNPAPARELPAALLATCDVVVPNEHELELVGGAVALLAAGVGAVVITRGGAGVEVVEPSGSWMEPAVAVDVVDTTGAGDAFCGALAARLAAGDGLRDAVRWAVAAGGIATTVAGAVPSMPTAAAIADLLSAAGPAQPTPPG